MQILLATGNPHKFAEIIALLPRQTYSGEKLIYVSLKDFPNLQVPKENGTTLEENAAIKAVSAAKQTGLMALSDDTGLEVDALNGQPGIHTARYAGEPANTQANNQKLLQALHGLPLAKRTARFRTVACLSAADGKTQYFKGTLEGYIGLDYQGKNGFGYDPIFVLHDTHKTLAEISPADKNKISHRAKAFAQVAEYLKQLTQ